MRTLVFCSRDVSKREEIGLRFWRCSSVIVGWFVSIAGALVAGANVVDDGVDRLAAGGCFVVLNGWKRFRVFGNRLFSLLFSWLVTDSFDFLTLFLIELLFIFRFVVESFNRRVACWPCLTNLVASYTVNVGVRPIGAFWCTICCGYINSTNIKIKYIALFNQLIKSHEIFTIICLYIKCSIMLTCCRAACSKLFAFWCNNGRCCANDCCANWNGLVFWSAV